MKFSAQHRQGQSNTHDTRFGVEINYRPGVPLSKQLDSDNVAAMREVQNRRYDFVERNNNIVLEYKRRVLCVLVCLMPLKAKVGQLFLSR